MESLKKLNLDDVKNKAKDIILRSPLGKTLTFVGAVIISGILCGAYINELTVNNEVQWVRSLKVAPTYLIIIYCVLLYLYNKALYNEDMAIQNFAEQDFTDAYLKSQYIPEVGSRYRKLIREGKIEELKELDSALKEMNMK
jgi:hypothetical protein